MALLFGLALPGFTQSDVDLIGLPMVSNYTPKTYKAGVQNWDITQDKLGFIYVANNMGVLQFDGQNWERFGASDTKIRSILQGDDGNIYIGSQADFGFLSPDQKGQLQYISLADSLPQEAKDFDETWKVFQKDGQIYFCTFKGIYVYDGRELSAIPSENRLDVSFLVNNEIFSYEYGKGLVKLVGGELKPVPNGAFFKDKRVSNILNYDKNTYFITTFEDGAFLYDGSVRPFKFKGDFWKDSYLINYSVRLRNGTIGLATQNAGFFLIDAAGELKLHLDKTTGLPDLTINYIFEDSHESLWLAMNNGLCRVDLNSPFTFIDDRQGISGSGYTALRQEDKLYLGTNIGLYVYEQGQIDFLESSEGQVYTIQEVNGHVLMGHDDGTFLVEGKQVSQISDEQGAWVFKVLPNAPDLILQGSYDGLSLFKSSASGVQFVRKISDFNESSRFIEFDGDDIWISHGYKGVFKLRLNETLTSVDQSTRYDSERGFPRDILIGMFRLSNQLLFTGDPGFFDYEESSDVFVGSTRFEGVFESETTMIDMEADVLGNIYFIERDRVGVLSVDPIETYELNTSSFNKIKAMWNDDLANIMVLDENNVLIGAKQGFIHYDPRKDRPRSTIPSLHFRSITNLGQEDSVLFEGHDYDGRSYEKVNGISFPYTQNAVSFDFISPHFESGNEVSYRYKLDGFDKEWSDWAQDHTKEYTNLREGSYEFRVIAKNIFDELSPELAYAFTIRPPFYRSILAYVFYFLGTIFTLFLGYKFLDKKYKSRTSLMEKEQGLALRKKEQEIQSITQRTEQEIVRLRNEKLQSEIDYKNQELTSSAMHLIQKNQLLATIKNTLKNVSREEKNRQLAGQLAKLVKSIDRDLEGGSEWEQFSESFDQVHGNFITRLKDKYPGLTPQEIKFAAYIRMNLNTKEIANLLGISVRGVEIGRYRVRKKLELERKDNLSDFLLRF